MSTLTINFPLNDFSITEVEETEDKILIYGETTETSVICHTCGKPTSHFHGYDLMERYDYWL